MMSDPAGFLFASLATPKTRQGPSSRLLQRRSLLLKEQVNAPEARPPDDEDHNLSHPSSFSPNFQASPVVRRSIFNMTSKLGESLIQVTRPLYSYHVASSVTGKSEADALLLATENLFVDFMSSGNVEVTKSSEVLDQVAEFEDMLEDHIQSIQSALNKNPNLTEKEYVNSINMKKNLTDERNTWRLVGKIFTLLSGGSENNDVQDEDMEMKENEPLTEVTVVRNLFDKDKDLKKAQGIVDWLEYNVRDELSGEEVSAYGDTILGWENTLHALILDKNKNGRLVTELDPDSKRRQGKPLHEIDESDEQRLVRMIFLYLRAGMLERAQKLCTDMGQPWRAATLVGWNLSHDPNNGSKDEEKMPMTGNLRRDIWKRTAWNMSCDPKLPSSERAIYSALCGNAKQLINSKCTSWEDMLWALTRSMVDITVEKEIRSTMNKKFVDLPNEYWDTKTDLESILQAVKSSELGNNSQDAASFSYHALQSCIMLGRWDELFEVANGLADSNDPHLLRFVVHLLLTAEKLLGHEVRDKQSVLESYVNYLVESSRVQQVAWYVSQMKPEDQVKTYSGFLETVEQDNDRVMCLNLGIENSLPMQDIRFRVVDNILAITVESDSSDEDDSLDEDKEDGKKISALKWLIYEPVEQEYAIVKSNQLARFYIAEQKFLQTKEVLKNIEHIIPEEDYEEEHCKEYHCLKMFVNAKEVFSDFFEFYHKGQPKKPVLMEGKNDYRAQVAYEQSCKQYEDDLKRWQNSLITQSQEVASHLMSILTLPGGWLLCQSIADSSISSEQSQSQRNKQLSYLRKVCLVECVFLLHSVLHDTRQFKEATRIADLIADERNGLYSLFSKEDMRRMLDKLKDSSVALIDNYPQKDPWGYPKQ